MDLTALNPAFFPSGGEGARRAADGDYGQFKGTIRELGSLKSLLAAAHSISIPTGRWSDPGTPARMNARFSRGRSTAEIKK